MFMQMFMQQPRYHTPLPEATTSVLQGLRAFDPGESGNPDLGKPLEDLSPRFM
jgi:hypothetical protein